MDQPFLTGNFEQTLDDKSRILIPASLRKSINPELHGDKYYITIRPNRRIWMYPDKYFRFLYSQDMAPDSLKEDELIEFDQITLSLAVEVEADKSGRIVIPEQTRSWAPLGKSVMVVGNRDHIEVWDGADFQASMGKLLDRGKDVYDRARMARRGEGITLRTQSFTGIPGNM